MKQHITTTLLPLNRSLTKRASYYGLASQLISNKRLCSSSTDTPTTASKKRFASTMASTAEAMTPNQENLVKKNKEYGANFTEGNLPIAPARKVSIVTCMDSRINALSAYGFKLGDAHIIRNAGGSAVDALRSIVISQQFLGTEEVMIFKHTNCGMVTFDNPAGVERIQKNLGEEAVEELARFNKDFLPFKDLDEAVKHDVEFLKGSKLIKDDVKISGWVHEIDTGKVRRVV